MFYMGDGVHVLAKNGTFLFRFDNGEFGSKWCGIWNGDKKYYDYFAFKVNGEFLSAENFVKLDFYNSVFAKHLFRPKTGPVIEETICLDGALLVKLRPEFDCDVSFEAGVNIRDRAEDFIDNKRYNITERDNSIDIGLDGLTAMLAFDTGKFEKREYYGVHSPGAYARNKGYSKHFDDCAVENKYVPGVINAHVRAGEGMNVVLSTKALDKDAIYKTIKNGTQNVRLHASIINALSASYGHVSGVSGEFIEDCMDAMISYANFSMKEIYAGFPFFNQFWLRDALLVLPSFLCINNAVFVKDVLKRIRSAGKGGAFPNLAGGSLFSADVPALFLIAVKEYLDWTHDLDMLRESSTVIKDSVAYGIGLLDGGLIHDSGKLTWMDTLDREYSVELQALWAKAFDCASDMLRLAGRYYDEAKMSSETIKSNMHRYKRLGYVSDQVKLDINSANQLFTVLFETVDENTSRIVLQNAEKNLLSEQGVLSVSAKDAIYDPNGYHNGAIWPFLTAVLAGAAFGHGRFDIGRRCLDIITSKNFGVQCKSRINEILEPSGVPRGCPSHAWSIGLLPFVIDRFMLGINVDAAARKVLVRKSIETVDFSRTLNLNRREIRLTMKNGRLSSNAKIVESSDYFTVIV